MGILKEANTYAMYNLLITQGADYALTVQFTEGDPIQATGAAVGATSIPLRTALKSPLSAGDKIDFDGVIATLSANAAVGALALSVNALAIAIPKTTGFKISDLTSYTIAAELQPPTGDSVAFTVTPTAPTDGVAVLRLTDVQTNALSTTLAAGQFPTEAEVQGTKYSGAEYQWVLSLTDGAGEIKKPLGGLALVSAIASSGVSGLGISPLGIAPVHQSYRVRLGHGYPSEIVSELNDLADVDAGSPTSGQVLAFDGTNWAPADGVPGLALATVADSAPPTGQNGQLWFNFSSNVLRVWYDDGWEDQTLDDGQY